LRSWIASIVFVGLLAPVAAFAQDEAPPPFAVSNMADLKKGVTDGVSAGEIIAAMNSSSFEFLPRHVYELVDMEAPNELIQAMSTKCALFFDANEDANKPLTKVASDARLYQKASELVLNDGNMVLMFEFFQDMHNEIEAAGKGVGSLEPKRSGELDRDFDKRQRDHAVAIVKAKAPFEGQIDAAVFQWTLTAEYEPVDARTNCTRAKLFADMEAVDFFVFRNTIGGLSNSTKIDIKSRTVETLELRSDGSRRIEGYSYKICGQSADSLNAKGVTLAATVSRSWVGEDWKGAGEFVDKNKNRIPAAR
jgi:hypothetical protein